jgi:hydroxyacylglutathione hydrolase
MTGTGTNTFILGHGEVAVIDPGPDDAHHLAAILAAMIPGERVAAIVVTHAHRDHSALVPALIRATGAPVYAFGPHGAGRSATMARLAAAGLASGGEGIDRDFRPGIVLRDGDRLGGGDWSLIALHTPGHLDDHLCLAWGDVLFTGDHVMGWAPSIVSPPDGDMGAYMDSLVKLAQQEWRLMLPAHGAPIREPAGRLAELTAHRKAREALILAAIDAGATSLDAITAHAYAGTDTLLMPAARRSALAHLIDLTERKLISADPAPLPDAHYHPL